MPVNTDAYGVAEVNDGTVEESSEDIHDTGPLGEEHSAPTELLPKDYERMDLKISGDLSSLTEDWNEDERKAGRRLVRFIRVREDSGVSLSFFPLSPQQRYEEDMQNVISCIKGPPSHLSHFVTSFDILKLVEYIVDIPLNIEIKNRARRNMAGIGSHTLAKMEVDIDSADSWKDDAFAKVMSFADPKPRSIEKSIKVYDWNVLRECLMRILSRFVCFIASTIILTNLAYR